ncbi:hypothetical protein EUTSA_v10023097mg, partial [Eutrema salsugineum]
MSTVKILAFLYVISGFLFVDRIEHIVRNPKSIHSLWLKSIFIKTADRVETYCSSLMNAPFMSCRHNIFNHGLSRHNILTFSQGFPIGLPCRNWIEVGLDAPEEPLLLELAVGNFPQGFKIHLSGSFQAVRLALFSRL